MASIAVTTPARHGNKSDSTIRGRSAASSSIPATRETSTSARSATPTDPTTNAGFTNPLTAASTGRMSSPKDRISALPTWRWRSASRRFFSPRHGTRIGRRGAPTRRLKAPATRSIGRKTAASTGRSSPATACPTAPGDAPASRSARTVAASTPPSTAKTTPASIARTTAATRGLSPAPMRG